MAKSMAYYLIGAWALPDLIMACHQPNPENITKGNPGLHEITILGMTKSVVLFVMSVLNQICGIW